MRLTLNDGSFARFEEYVQEFLPELEERLSTAADFFIMIEPIT